MSTGITGIQTKDVSVDIDDNANVTDADGRKFRAYSTQIEWDVGYRIRQLQSVTRGYGIKDVAIVDT